MAILRVENNISSAVIDEIANERIRKVRVTQVPVRPTSRPKFVTFGGFKKQVTDSAKRAHTLGKDNIRLPRQDLLRRNIGLVNAFKRC